MENIVIYYENKPVRSFQLKPLGLVVEGTPPITEWLAVYHTLAKCEQAVQWWIGDWLNYGESSYGDEKYAQALQETHYKSIGSLKNLKYIANQVKLSRRRDDLEWSHHAEVARLEPENQIEWLQKAADGEWSVATLRAAIKDSKMIAEHSDYSPSWLRYTDVWNFPACDDRFGIDYPGRIPGQIVLNALHYFSKEGDLIVDPMAGGGVTIDACQEMNRRCITFDIESNRNEMLTADATLPWPIPKARADLVFMDPPYWSQMEDDYGGMAAMDYDVYLGEMKKVFDNANVALKTGGVLAVLIAPMAIKTEYRDIPFDFVQLCNIRGFQLVRRIFVPVSSQQVGPRVMAYCRENSILVAVMRDLLIFRKINSLPWGDDSDCWPEPV